MSEKKAMMYKMVRLETQLQKMTKIFTKMSEKVNTLENQIHQNQEEIRKSNEDKKKMEEAFNNIIAIMEDKIRAIDEKVNEKVNEENSHVKRREEKGTELAENVYTDERHNTKKCN